MTMVSSGDAIAHLEDVVHQLGGLVMRHAGGRFVQQKELRPADQRAANLDAAAIDHRQAGDGIEHAVGERRIEHLHQRSGFLEARLAFGLEGAAPHQIEPDALFQPLVVADHDVVEDRQRQRQARALEGARDAGMVDGLRRGMGDVATAESDAAGIGRVDAGHDVEEGGLAGAVGTDQAENLALAHVEVEPVERHHAAEPLGQPLRDKHAHGRHPGK